MQVEDIEWVTLPSSTLCGPYVPYREKHILERFKDFLYVTDYCSIDFGYQKKSFNQEKFSQLLLDGLTNMSPGEILKNKIEQRRPLLNRESDEFARKHAVTSNSKPGYASEEVCKLFNLQLPVVDNKLWGYNKFDDVVLSNMVFFTILRVLEKLIFERSHDVDDVVENKSPFIKFIFSPENLGDLLDINPNMISHFDLCSIPAEMRRMFSNPSKVSIKPNDILKRIYLLMYVYDKDFFTITENELYETFGKNLNFTKSAFRNASARARKKLGIDKTPEHGKLL